jgi:SAM-dependent methyltransferase
VHASWLERFLFSVGWQENDTGNKTRDSASRTPNFSCDRLKTWLYSNSETTNTMTQPDDNNLEHISRKTVAHYSDRADEFWERTRDHDVQQNIEALLRHLPAESPLHLLDFGCGPGRDLVAFRDLGHAPVGLEGSAPFAAMARMHSGCDVWEQDFLALNLPANRFDGIFANASLFHVPRQELPRVLRELHATLKPEGVLFTSNPRGNNEEGWNRERYGAYHDLESWRTFLEDANFTELEYYFRPADVPPEEQHWLASAWRKR